MIINEVTVSVCMITYNQEPYIRQAIKGVLMQKCNFKVELVIGEDCSTDNTRRICEEYAAKYPQINLLSSKSNLGIMKNFLKAINACNGIYIAFCEGDDYWTDPYKLQKQVDFLESNEDYSLVYTDTLIYHQESSTFKKTFSSYYKDKPISGNIFKELLLRNFIQTLTVLARKECIMEAVENIKDSINMFKMGDYPLWLEIAHSSKIKYLNDITTVYRVSANTASSHNDLEKRYDFAQSAIDVQFYFCKKYNLTDIQDEIQNNYYRFLCKKALDLKTGNIDANIIKSFKPISIRDKIIIFSFSSNYTYVLASSIIRRFAIYRLALKNINELFLRSLHRKS